MKRLAFFIGTLLACASAEALSVGNPAETALFLCSTWPDDFLCSSSDPTFIPIWSLRGGFYGDYVFNRHLEIDQDVEDSQARQINATSVYTNAGYVCLNLLNRFEVFSTLGETQMHIFADQKAFDRGTSTALDLQFESAFSWSLGVRASLLQCNHFGVGLEGQYMRSRPMLRSVLNGSTGAFSYLPEDTRTTYSEWQWGLATSYSVEISPSCLFVPYVAIKCAGARINELNDVLVSFDGALDVLLHDLDAAKVCGFAIGSSLFINAMMGITLEARFADEKALSLKGQMRF